MPGPYAQAWEDYQDLGWQGTLPLPERRKHHPPRGYTGAAGAWPTYADCWDWSDDPTHEGANIALRLPDGIIGIDVDAYDGKPGAATLAAAEQQWGALPPTWRTTSRDDGTSGIRLYRTPTGLAWPGEAGPGIDIIQERHRYAVAPPSTHPEGRTYRWITPHGATSTVPPDPHTLPTLPANWVLGLTRGHQATHDERADLDDEQTKTWLTGQERATQAPCQRMRHQLDTALHTLTQGSAHNNANTAAIRLIRLSDEGHAGLDETLTHLRAAFTAEITRPGRPGERTPGQAAAEWDRNITGAVRLVAAKPSTTHTCDCGTNLADLIAPPPPNTAQDTPGSEASPPAGDSENHQEGGAERTSWWPRNLHGVLTGQEEEPPPTLLARGDGVHLWYGGKVNGLLGESESGKTWVALLGVAQTLAGGGRVAYLDFEDTPAGIVSRLRAMGVPGDHFARLDYIGPDETLHLGAQGDIADYMNTAHPALVVIDGVNAAMTLMGLDLTSNTDATRFTQTLLRPLTTRGAAVVAIDHVPKSKEGRGKGGIGAQAKRAMMTGCAISVEVAEPFGRGMTGRLRLYVDKDRPGFVRAQSEEARFAGTAILESNGESGEVAVIIRPPGTTASQAQDGRITPRISAIMEKVSSYLASGETDTSLRSIRKAVPGRPEAVAEAVEHLVRGGYVVRAGTENRYRHNLVRAYTALEELIAPPGEATESDENGGQKWFPSGSHPVFGTESDEGLLGAFENGQTDTKLSGSVVPKWFPSGSRNHFPDPDGSGSPVPTPLGGNRGTTPAGPPGATPHGGNHPAVPDVDPAPLGTAGGPRRIVLIDGRYLDTATGTRLERDGDDIINPENGELYGNVDDLTSVRHA